MLCYRCSTVMQKLPHDSNLVDWCPNCRSTWLDGGELEKILSGRGSSISQLVREARLEVRQEEVNGSTKGLCPRCDSKKLDHYVHDGIELDMCEMCKGTLYDDGELERFLDQERPFLDRVCAWVAKLFTQPHKHTKH